jgi:anaerobic magnesium-protoporphyrin IX monomethyl ester cyclase
MREYLRVAFNRVPIGVQRKESLQRVVHGMIGLPARWRLDHELFTRCRSSCG